MSGVCIAGATGHLGSAIVEEFCYRKKASPVVAIARNSASSQHISHFRNLNANVVFVDACNDEDGEDEDNCSYGLSCFENVSTAISCLASVQDFWAIDRDATIRFGRQAIRYGVNQLVLIATFEGKDSRSVSEFSDVKEQAVDILRDECRKQRTVFTVIRPTAFFKDLSNMPFDRIWNGTNRHIVLGDGLHRINPIAREDVAVFIADSVEQKLAGEFPMGGPDIFSFREIGELAAEVIHQDDDHEQSPLRIHAVPLWLLRLLVMVFSVFSRVSQSARRLVAILHWMIYVSSHDAIAPCYGERHLRDEYERKLETYRHRQQEQR